MPVELLVWLRALVPAEHVTAVECVRLFRLDFIAVRSAALNESLCTQRRLLCILLRGDAHSGAHQLLIREPLRL